MDLRNSYLVAATLLTLAGADQAAPIRVATPQNLAEVVRHAQPGQSLTLAPGEYRNIRISKCHFDPAVTLNASAAIFYGLLFTDCDGVRLKGGEFRLPPPAINPATGALVQGRMALRFDRSNNITVKDARFVGPGHPDTGEGLVYGEGFGFWMLHGNDVVVEDSNFTGFEVAVALNHVDNFRVSRVTSTAMRSDGVQVADGHHGVIEYVRCSGTVIRDKEHPDCIQGWSIKGSVPTSDVVVRHNTVVGDTQGISFFKSSANDQGGFDRITIEDNDVEVSYPSGITLDDGRDSIVRRNHVRTLGNVRNRTMLRSTGAKACDNVIGPGGGKPGFTDGKC